MIGAFVKNRFIQNKNFTGKCTEIQNYAEHLHKLINMYFCKEAKELFADVCVTITWIDNIVTDENLGDEPMMKLQDI